MSRVGFFLKIFIVTFIVASVFFLVKTSNPILSLLHAPLASVKGASTERTEKITEAIVSDIGDGLEIAKKQVLNTKVSDIIGVASRAQRIPKDVENMREYVKEQLGNVLKLGK